MTRVEDLEHDGNEWVPAIAPLGADPEHCAGCHRAWLQERCGHSQVAEIEVTTLTDVFDRWFRFCTECGKDV